MFEELTAKQETIVAYVTQGLRNREIAVLLGTTEQVVKNHLRGIYDKLGASSRLELAKLGLKKSGIPAPFDTVAVQRTAQEKPASIPSFVTLRPGLEERQAEMRARMLRSRNHRGPTSETVAPPALDEKQAGMRERWTHVGMDLRELLAPQPVPIELPLPPLRPAPSAAPMPTVREVMNIRQAANYLGISQDTLYKCLNGRKVPAFKIGNRWRFSRMKLEQWMNRKSELMMHEGSFDPRPKFRSSR